MNFDEWYEQEIGSENKPEYEAAKWAWDYQEKIIVSLNAGLRKNSKNKQKLLGENIELKRQLDCCREENKAHIEKINEAIYDLQHTESAMWEEQVEHVIMLLKGNQDD